MNALIQLWIACNLVVACNNPVRDIQRKLQVNPEWLLIGELDGEIVASCMAGYEGHRGWINYLAVTPAHQRRGFARQIMHQAKELLCSAGCPKINLMFRVTNSEVIEFYKHIGYEEARLANPGKRLRPDEPYLQD